MTYYTIQKVGKGEYEEKKSRFLGEAIPVTSEDEIASHLERIRKQYYDARHHCYAYVLGVKRDNKKASDDGEPSGTAGLPILKVMEGAECTGILIVVTRYFGGTLLGTGGLVRAYTAAAKAALADAGLVCMKEGRLLEIAMDYGLYDPICHYLKQTDILIKDTQYTNEVTMTIAVPEDEIAETEKKLQGMSAGRVRIQEKGRNYYGF